MRTALRHPFGLSLVIATLLLVGLTRFVPGLEPWSARAPWILLSGVLAYVASVIILYRSGPAPIGLSSNDAESRGEPSDEFPRLVEVALRQMNNPDALSRCQLVHRLPGTLAATRSRLDRNDTQADPTPLEQAQSLREVLVSAIDRLKPPQGTAGAGGPEALQYHILHEEYVRRESTRYVMGRLSIGEGTFYRNRRGAISAVARHLETQEELMVRGQPQG